MAPTSIDGTEITGATIDGQDVSEITVDGETVFTAIPDSTVSRSDDNKSTGNNNGSSLGMAFKSTKEWSKIQAVVSAISTDLDTAYLYDSSGNVLYSTSILNKNPGEEFTIDYTIQPDTEYSIEVDGGSIGYNGSESFPQTNAEGDLTLTNTSRDGDFGAVNDPGGIVTIGNISL